MKEINTRMDITVTGVCEKDGVTEPVDFSGEQVSAAVVLTFRRHNEHTLLNQGIIMGEFSPKYYTMVIRELINTWGWWPVCKAAACALVNLLPYRVLRGGN